MLGALYTSCSVAPAHDPATPNPPPWSSFEAIWDTGATNTVITQEVVAACGLLPIGMVQVQGVHGTEPSEVYFVNLALPNGVAFPNVRVTKGRLPGGTSVLIGMDIITTGDFSVTNFGGKTIFSFRVPSQHHVDFVQEHQAATQAEFAAMERPPGELKHTRRKKHKTFGKNKRRKR